MTILENKDSHCVWDQKFRRNLTDVEIEEWETLLNHLLAFRPKNREDLKVQMLEKEG